VLLEGLCLGGDGKIVEVSYFLCPVGEISYIGFGTWNNG
jgi:hypothetical protein